MKSENIVFTVIIASLLIFYIVLSNQPRAEPREDLRERFSIDAEHESLKESYKAAELEAVETETVKAVSLSAIQVYTSEKVQTISLEEFENISRVVMNEAGGESYSCQVAVAETIINRINADCFPDTVKEVLNQTHQFSHAENGEVTDSVREAVSQALEYHIFNEDMLYFRSDYYHDYDETADYIEIDNMYFSTKKGPSTDQSNKDLNK